MADTVWIVQLCEQPGYYRATVGVRSTSDAGKALAEDDENGSLNWEKTTETYNHGEANVWQAWSVAEPDDEGSTWRYAVTEFPTEDTNAAPTD